MLGFLKKAIFILLIIFALLVGGRVIYKLMKEPSKEEPLKNNKTESEKYLDELEDKLNYYLLFGEKASGYKPNWSQISTELNQFSYGEIKVDCEKVLENIKTNPYYPKEFQKNKDESIEELKKILENIS